MPKSVRSFDRITIPAPCDAAWDEMIGNDQVRFCEHSNLLALAREGKQKEIIKLLESRGAPE